MIQNVLREIYIEDNHKSILYIVYIYNIYRNIILL